MQGTRWPYFGQTPSIVSLFSPPWIFKIKLKIFPVQTMEA